MNNELIKEVIKAEENVIVDFVELGIDSFLDEGVVKDIPIIGSIVGIYKIGKSIRDAFFIKKLINFIYNLKNISTKERQKFIDKCIYEDKNFQEKLICTLDKIDDIDKCKYLSKIFICYGKGYITYLEFRRYMIAIERLNVENILYLKVNIDKKYFDFQHGVSLLNAGLVEIAMFPGNAGYEKTDETIQLYKCLFEYE